MKIHIPQHGIQIPAIEYFVLDNYDLLRSEYTIPQNAVAAFAIDACSMCGICCCKANLLRSRSPLLPQQHGSHSRSEPQDMTPDNEAGGYKEGRV